MDPEAPPASAPHPPAANYILSFLLVSFCWGFTTPFIRRAAVSYTPSPLPPPASRSLAALARHKAHGALRAVWGLLRAPAYALPLLANVTGSVWFFVLVGQAELSVTVPVVNSLAFLWTVAGEWWAEGKGVGRDTWIGMAFVAGGIALCVQSKS